jgi:cytochrome P450/NADPH-cytochrome P450 reductase
MAGGRRVARELEMTLTERTDARSVAVELPEYPWEEIRRHNRHGDLWIVLDGFVYDVSEWMDEHPGGAEVLVSSHGADASEAFAEAMHSTDALAQREVYRIGRVSAQPAAETATALDDEPLEIPYAVRWLVPRGERFANFPLLNDNDTQLDYYRRFGHIYAVGIPTKKWRLVVVSDAELLDEVADNEEQFGKPVEEINFFAQLANSRGGGISVIGDGEHYERIRRVMLPWYGQANQRTQLERVKEQARNLVDAWAALPDDEPLDARAWMERYTLEVSGRGACNYDFGLFGGGEPHAFAAAVPESTKESIARVAEPFPDFTLLSGRAKRAKRKRYRRNNEELFRTADALVRGRLHTCPMGRQTDLLSRLVTTPDPETGEQLDVETIRDQVLMHLSNGFNGPSITGGWLAYVLATHPDVEEKVIAEIDGITGGDPSYDLQWDDLMRLQYTTQVIKETLRVYPPMPVTIRRSLKDGLLGRYRIRKGDIVLVGTLAAQRDPRYWGPEPERFDPEHFAREKVVARPRHAFIPFSVGRRQCMAQELTFLMLRIVLFEIYRRYRLRLAPGATVAKNTIVTTKPVAVPVVRLPRQVAARPAPSPRVAETASSPAAPVVVSGRGWDQPSEIPATSLYRHVVVAYGSNFGANRELADRFAERSRIYGYTSEVLTLNELAEQPPRTEPWLLSVMTSTYTGNPPSNATAFKAWLDRTKPGAETWRNCRYLVWGLGNSQWNAFLAFPRHVHRKLEELGATPLSEFMFGDVNTPAWEGAHTEWNEHVWPVLLELSGARPSEEAAARIAAERAEASALTSVESGAAIAMSLAEGEILAPTIMTNAVGIETVEARVRVSTELQAPESAKWTRHLELTLPPGFAYTAGDHVGICPQNDEERVERVAAHLGVVLDGLFRIPKTMEVHAVPREVVLEVRNVLTNLVDLHAMPTAALLDLLAAKATEPGERTRLEQIREVVRTADGADSPFRATVMAGGYDVLQLLDEFPSCSLNLFEFLQVAQPVRPRYYSTSSSPRIHGEGVAQVAVALNPTPVPGAEREFRGLSAHYMHMLRERDRVNVFLDRAQGFHLQEDVTKPMIFVCVGTGFAPMRAFLWERLADKREGVSIAEAILFNGVRSTDLDYIYRDEIERFVAEGVLQSVRIASSRRRPDRREYVQDRIRQEGELVWRLLQEGAYVYVCGSRPMREGVRAAFVDVVAEHGSRTRDDAESYLQRLETVEDRYRPDVWG